MGLMVVAQTFAADHSLLVYGTLLFLNALLAGPMLTMVCGGLLAHYHLSFPAVYACTVAGDVVNDGVYYWIGRCHAYLPERAQSRLAWVIGTSARLASLRDQLESHPFKVLTVAKIKYGVGFTKLTQAGASGFPYRRYALACLPITPVQSALFLGIGMVGGSLEQEASFWVRVAMVCLVGFAIANSPIKRLFAKKSTARK